VLWLSGWDKIHSPWAKKRFEEYEKRSKSQGTPVVSMPFDKSDLENERKEPATVAEEIIRRGIQSKALKITDRSAVDIQPEDRLYRSDYHFMPETAIQWTKSKLPLFLLFPFREENPNNLQIVSELEKWLYYDLWNPTELRDLCCGLEPDLSRWDSLSERIWKAKDQHLPIDPKDRALLSTLTDADESIRRAVIASVLAPCMDNDDWKNKAYPQNLFFKPAVAIKWARTRFEAFPFREEDCPVKEVMQKIETVLPEKTPQATWTLKPLDEIQRMPGYRAILRQTLQKMFEEGKPSVPTAYEVLQSWRVKFTDKPQSAEEYPKIYVHDHYFKYENKDGFDLR
jgi:hypothetical protein